MKFVSVLTSDARGGAEFGAASMLEALIAEGHEVMLLSDQPEIAAELGVPSESIELGAKLSTRSYWRLAVTWPLELRRLRAALMAQMPYDVLIVHYKKEQLLASMLPAASRPACSGQSGDRSRSRCERGSPGRPTWRHPPSRGGDGGARRAPRDSVCDIGVPADKVVVVPNAVRPDEIRFRPEGREPRPRAELGIPADAFVVGCISRLHPKKRNDVVVEAVGSSMENPSDHGRRRRDRGGSARAGAGPSATAPTSSPPRAMTRSPTVLSAFDVSVFCPSPTEGAPRAVILGMLAERPCLATGAEGVADMIDVSIGGITVPENDPRALAELIRASLEDLSLAGRQGAGARRLAVERYGPGAVAGQIEALVDGAARRDHG